MSRPLSRRLPLLLLLVIPLLLSRHTSATSRSMCINFPLQCREGAKNPTWYYNGSDNGSDPWLPMRDLTQLPDQPSSTKFAIDQSGKLEIKSLGTGFPYWFKDKFLRLLILRCEAQNDAVNATVFNKHRIVITETTFVANKTLMKCCSSEEMKRTERQNLTLDPDEKHDLTCAASCPQKGSCNMQWCRTNASTSIASYEDCPDSMLLVQESWDFLRCDCPPCERRLDLTLRWNHTMDGIYVCRFRINDYAGSRDWIEYASAEVKTKPNLLLRLLLPLLAGVVVIAVVVVAVVRRDSIRLRLAQMILNRRRRKLTSGEKVVIFCADGDAADAERQLATPLRNEGVVVQMEHGVEWNVEDAAVADAIAAAVAAANAVIFVLSVEYLAGGEEGNEEAAAARLQNKTASLSLSLVYDAFLGSPFPVLFVIPQEVYLGQVTSSPTFRRFESRKRLAMALNVWPVLASNNFQEVRRLVIGDVGDGDDSEMTTASPTTSAKASPTTSIQQRQPSEGGQMFIYTAPEKGYPVRLYDNAVPTTPTGSESGIKYMGEAIGDGKENFYDEIS